MGDVAKTFEEIREEVIKARAEKEAREQEVRKIYYVVFKPCELQLLKRWLKPGFGHCTLLINDGFNWIYVDPAMDRPLFQILPLAPTAPITDIKDLEGCAKVRIMMSKKARAFPLKTTCVSMVKQLMGLRGCWAITPWQFYKWFKKLKPALYGKYNIHSIELL